MAQDWPTVSYLQKAVYEPNCPGGLLIPPGGLIASISAYADIVRDVAAKEGAGYPVSIADAYGRFLACDLGFPGPDCGVSLTLSNLTTYSNFTNHNVPYPIISSLGFQPSAKNCTILLSATQYEYTPYEFGSWDAGINVFTQLAYLGTSIMNGTAAPDQVCRRGFDNLGFFTASTSNVFPYAACDPLFQGSSEFDTLANAFKAVLLNPDAPELATVIPNPFQGLAGSPAVSGNTSLTLQDGGASGQNDPIWPLIQGQRNLSAIVVVDSCGENTTTYNCTGGNLYNTYIEAQAHNLTKMPVIPSEAVFAAKNLTTGAQFFGCNQPDTVTLIWLLLISYAYDVNYSGEDVDATVLRVEGTIKNGNLIATQNNDAQWPTCLACAIMMKTTPAGLPSNCTACFSRYCAS